MTRDSHDSTPMPSGRPGSWERIPVAVVVQVYAFTDDDGSRHRFSIGEGLAFARARGETVDFCPAECGIDRAHILARYPDIDEAYALGLPTDALEEPLLFVPWRGKHLLIDGWHRLMKGVLTGREILPACILTEEETRQILLLPRAAQEIESQEGTDGPAG